MLCGVKYREFWFLLGWNLFWCSGLVHGWWGIYRHLQNMAASYPAIMLGKWDSCLQMSCCRCNTCHAKLFPTLSRALQTGSPHSTWWESGSRGPSAAHVQGQLWPHCILSWRNTGTSLWIAGWEGWEVSHRCVLLKRSPASSQLCVQLYSSTSLILFFLDRWNLFLCCVEVFLLLWLYYALRSMMYFEPRVVPVMNSAAKFVLFTQRAWKFEGCGCRPH